MKAHNPSGHNHFEDFTRQATHRLALSLGITAAFVVGEVVAGSLANSLALLSDAAHNVTDVAALALSWFALRLAARPANPGRTFGYHRFGILVALINSTSLVVIALGIFYEAVRRLINPPEVQPAVLIWVGAVAFLVNLVTAWLVKRGSEHDLNLRSVFLHLIGDVLSTVGAVLAGIAILFTGLNWLDPLVSVLIGLLILWNAWGILHESVNILLESTPADIDMSQMVSDLMGVEGVRGVHDLHVWSINRDLRMLSAHILTDNIWISDGGAIQRQVSTILLNKYGIAHATLQLECVGCEPALLYCDMDASVRDHS